jgi:hypothetical protein
MGKYIIAVLALAGIAWATAPFSDVVGTSSLKLVAAKPVAWTAWTTNTVYAQGAVVKSGGYYYFAVDAGLTTNAAPTHTSGEVTANGMTWRQISPNKRQGVVVTVKTDAANGGRIDLSLGTASATNGAGLRLVGEGATLIFSPGDNYNGEINVVSGSGSNVTVGVQEF